VPTSNVVGRVAAIFALIGAVAVVLLLVVGGGSTYTVTAQFENASQLVSGNNVSVAGAYRAAGRRRERWQRWRDGCGVHRCSGSDRARRR
jgi:hypothetical protein